MRLRCPRVHMNLRRDICHTQDAPSAPLLPQGVLSEQVETLRGTITMLGILGFVLSTHPMIVSGLSYTGLRMPHELFRFIVLQVQHEAVC